MRYYQKMLNAHALNVLTKPAQIPDYHLMIGTAEDLTSQPIIISADYLPPEVLETLKDYSQYSNQEIADMIANNQIEVNDLNATVAGIGAGIWGV